MSLAERIAQIRSQIEAARNGAPLAAPRISLLGACKGQGEDLIEEAIKSGLTMFGENRVQEAEEKWPKIKTRHPSVQLHLIGPLQSNKAKQAVELFDAIQTIDRMKLTDAIAEAMGKTNRRIDCYVQINTGKELQKAGALPEEADALILHCKKIGLPLVGLMCIPPVGQAPAPHFAYLRELAKKHGLTELSMGMSEDFETAVRLGATCVRIGRAVFGERNA